MSHDVLGVAWLAGTSEGSQIWLGVCRGHFCVALLTFSYAVVKLEELHNGIDCRMLFVVFLLFGDVMCGGERVCDIPSRGRRRETSILFWTTEEEKQLTYSLK